MSGLSSASLRTGDLVEFNNLVSSRKSATYPASLGTGPQSGASIAPVGNSQNGERADGPIRIGLASGFPKGSTTQ